MSVKLFKRRGCERRNTTCWRVANFDEICAGAYMTFSRREEMLHQKIIFLDFKNLEKHSKSCRNSQFQALTKQVEALFIGLIL